MKKKMAWLLALSLLSGSVVSWAEEAEMPVAGEPVFIQPLPAVTMTEADAILYALEHSLALASANAECVSARYSKTEASNTQKQYRKAEMVASSIDIGLITTGYYYRMAERKIEMADRNLESKKNTLKTQVKNDFYTYLSGKNKTALAEQNLLSAKEKASYAKARYENGMITKNDYLRFDLAILSAENAVKSAKRQEEIRLRVLKDTLNFPQNQELIVDGSFTYEEQEYKKPQDAVTLSRSQNTYKNLFDTKYMAEERWNFAKEFYFTHQTGYTIEQKSYEVAVSDFEQNVRSMDTNLYNAYYNILTIKENMEYLRKNIELMQVDTEATYLRYEMGMLTANDYFDAQQSLASMQNDLLDLELSYYIAVCQYKALYTTE